MPRKRGGGDASAGKTAGDGERAKTAKLDERLVELKEKAARAAEVIAGLHESNHALKGEVAELSRKIASLEASPAPAGPASEIEETIGREEAAASSREREQLSLLLQERKTIRKKVENLLARISRLDS